MKEQKQYLVRTPLMQGRDLKGRPLALNRGQVTMMCVFHDADCPGAKGRPDLCNCTPDVRFAARPGTA